MKEKTYLLLSLSFFLLTLGILLGLSVAPGLKAKQSSMRTPQNGWLAGRDGDWDCWSNYPHMFSIPPGNIGIGTAEPDFKLHVEGTTRTSALAIPGGGGVAWGDDNQIEASFNDATGKLEWSGPLVTERLNEVRVSTMFATPFSSTAGIQEAIEDLPASGGAIFIPSGNHLISSPISLSDYSQIMLFGAGWSSAIINLSIDSGDTLNISGGSRVIIKDLRITGNPSSGDGIHLSMVDTFLIQNVYVHQNGNYGIYLEGCGELADPTLNACYVIQNGNDGVHCAWGVHDFLVTSCHIEENNGNGIYFSNGFDLTVVGTNVEDHAAGCEVLVDGAYSTVITGSTLETYGGTAAIRLMNTCNRVVITGNTIESVGDGTGIWVSNGVYETGVVISSNNFWRIGTCIDIDNVTINGVILGNVFTICATTIVNEGSNVDVAHNVGVPLK